MSTRNAIIKDRNWKFARIRGAAKQLKILANNLLTSAQEKEMYSRVLSGLESKLVAGADAEFNRKLVALTGIVEQKDAVINRYNREHKEHKEHKEVGKKPLVAANSSSFTEAVSSSH